MEQLTLEGIAEAAYADAKLDADRPDVVRLAHRLLGPDAISRGPRPIRSPAALVRLASGYRIILSRSMPSAYELHAIAHELGHYLLRTGGHVTPDIDEEASADYLGAALIAPRRAFLSARRAIGEDLAQLAETFGITETGAALRLGEVTGQPLAVIAPASVRVRGEGWSWPDERTLRRWAQRPVPGLRKTRLTDDPRRVVLDVDEAATG